MALSPTTRAAALALSLLAPLICVSAAPAWPSSTPGHETADRAVPKPKVDWDPIPYDKRRKKQMAAYSKRHYGNSTWRLRNPKTVVLHYTATSTYEPVFNTFASNAPALGESPGVCSQFVVDKDGTIHQLTRLYVRCRHTVGLNHVAIGIEMVQEAESGRHEADRDILDRRGQSRAAVQLVAWLKQRYRISMKDIIGHAMANGSPRFKDLEGWRNDHVDWLKGDVRDFRNRVSATIRDNRG